MHLVAFSVREGLFFLKPNGIRDQQVIKTEDGEEIGSFFKEFFEEFKE